MNDKQLIEKSKELDAEIVAMPRDKVFTKRTVVVGFLLIMGALGYLNWSVRDYAQSTNEAVTREIPRLESQIVERDETITDQNSVIQQSTDAIVLLIETLRLHGIEPPEIIIRPED